MKILYYHSSCPFSREIRFILKEKKIDFVIEENNFWERNLELLKMNPAGELPILNDNGILVCGISPIIEHVDECYKEARSLIGERAETRAEVRRVATWFNEKFYREVTKPILNEKVIKYYKRVADTNSQTIRAAKNNIFYHLDYIDYLLAKSDWLGGDNLSIADFAAASQLSILDYLSDIPWDYNRNVRDWYSVIKSRPSFRDMLEERIPGFSGPKHYIDLDF